MHRRQFLRLTGCASAALAALPLVSLLPSPSPAVAQWTHSEDTFCVGDVLTFGNSPRQFVVTDVGEGSKWFVALPS